MATKNYKQMSDHDSKKDHQEKEKNHEERDVEELGGDGLKENDKRYSTPTNEEE